MYKKNLSEDTYGAPLSGQGASAEIQASVASQEAQTPMANQAAGPIPLAGQGPQAVMDQGNMNYWRGGGPISMQIGCSCHQFIVLLLMRTLKG